MNTRPLHILIAGGGTGGHLFPGIAIAQSFLSQDSAIKILFVNAGRPIDESVLSKAGFVFKKISSGGIKGLGLRKKIVSALKASKGIVESVRIIKNFRPDLVVGVGGYSSGPLVMGAWLLGIKSVLHEQNILPGITNRMLQRFVSRIYVSFEKSQNRFNPEKTLFTGNPVRAEILSDTAVQDNGDEKDSDVKPFTILILGGSQGAHAINMSVVDALKHIDKKEDYCFVHQTGPIDESSVQNVYTVNNVSAVVRAFFDDMPKQYKNADLIICRAGATTVAEITAIGKGVIFIPFPYAADNHQELNAQALLEAGAAEMILEEDLSGKILADRIQYYHENRNALKDMASKSQKFGKPNAADDIVEDCYQLINRLDNEVSERQMNSETRNT